MFFVVAAANAAVAQQAVSTSAKPSHAESSAKPGSGVAAGEGNTAAPARPAANAAPKGDAGKVGTKQLPTPNVPLNTGSSKGSGIPAPGHPGVSKGPSIGPAVKEAPNRAGKAGTPSGNNEIDTRITVQPHPPLKPVPKANVTTTFPRKSLSTVHQSSPRENASPVRNAAGVLMSAPGPAKAPVFMSVPNPAHGSVVGSTGPAAAAGSSTGARQAPSSSIRAAPRTNTGVVTGTGVTRPGVGAGVIGGPAKNVAGINGSTVRSKQP
jgi:hypothetical protein